MEEEKCGGYRDRWRCVAGEITSSGDLVALLCVGFGHSRMQREMNGARDMPGDGGR